ncbi:MAG: YwaF family protein [Clostridiales bacterium]|jgi:hypothetical protein|nr:YwaF family protein [Clostridiales bacterium]
MGIQKILSITSLVVLNVLAIMLFILAVKRLKSKKLDNTKFTFLCVFCVILSSFGLAFLTSDNFAKFGLLHCMLIITTLTTPFALFILVTTKRTHEILLTVFSVVVLILMIFKFFYNIPFYQMLPLNICNLASIFLVLRLFFKNKSLDNYILVFGILGGFFNVILGVEYHSDFFVARTFESNTMHHLFFTISIYLLLSKEIKPDTKTSTRNLYWILPLFVVLVFTNEIFEFNFFYTSRFYNPIVAVYNLFPKFSFTVSNTLFEINIIYYLLLILCTVVVQWSVSYLFVKLDKKIKPKLYKSTDIIYSNDHV